MRKSIVRLYGFSLWQLLLLSGCVWDLCKLCINSTTLLFQTLLFYVININDYYLNIQRNLLEMHLHFGNPLVQMILVFCICKGRGQDINIHFSGFLTK